MGFIDDDGSVWMEDEKSNLTEWRPYLLDRFRWTKDAKICYKRGCNCRYCPIGLNMSTKCKMKFAVRALILKGVKL